MKLAQSIPTRFNADFRTRFLPLAIGFAVMASLGIGYFAFGETRPAGPPPRTEIDGYTRLLRTGVIDVTRPSPTDPSITEVVRFLPDGRVQVIERMRTQHFLSAGGRPPPPRESRPPNASQPATPQERAQGIAETFHRR